MAVTTTEQDEVAQVRAQLAGQVLRIPNFQPLFRGLPSGVSPHLDKLRSFVDQRLESVVSVPKHLDYLKRCDFGWFAAVWWPTVSFERLKLATVFALWLFVWDDLIDMSDSELSDDMDLFGKTCQQHMNFVRWALRIDDDPAIKETAKFRAVEPTCPKVTKKFFGEFAEAMCQSSTRAHRETLYGEIELYFTSLVKEQRNKFHHRLGTTEEYLETRVGTSGSGTLCAILDYITETHIPDWILESEHTKRMHREANMVTILTNDMYSLKKEMKQGALESLIPVMWSASPEKDIDVIASKISNNISVCLETMKADAAQLDALTKDDELLNKDVNIWINTLFTMMTGCVEHHLGSDRYGLKPYLQEDTSVIVTL